ERVQTLYDNDFFKQNPDGSLYGVKLEFVENFFSGEEEMQLYDLTVAADGSLALRLENILKEFQQRPVAWNRYVLPTGPSLASHEVKYADSDGKDREVRSAYNSLSITKYFLRNTLDLTCILDIPEDSQEVS